MHIAGVVPLPTVVCPPPRTGSEGRLLSDRAQGGVQTLTPAQTLCSSQMRKGPVAAVPVHLPRAQVRVMIVATPMKRTRLCSGTTSTVMARRETGAVALATITPVITPIGPVSVSTATDVIDAGAAAVGVDVSAIVTIAPIQKWQNQIRSPGQSPPRPR